MMQPRKWSLVEVPDHLGVMNVGGRVGACHGPKAFTSVFSRLRGRYPILGQMLGPVRVTGIGSDINENHRHAADAVRDAHGESALTVVVGGGHDHGYSQLLGIHEALGPEVRLGCINIDAHLDVRPPAPLLGSGSPFFLAIESGILDPKNLVEFGIQSHCNSSELWDYVEKKQIEVITWNSLRAVNRAKEFQRCLERLSSRVDAIVMSLDLDSLAQAYCPGVSAPQAEGFNSQDIIEMMEVSGKNPKVVSLGIFELSPEHDLQEATARVAATSAFHFLEASLANPS